MDVQELEFDGNLYADLPKFRIGVLLNDHLICWYNIRNTRDLCDAFIDASKRVSKKDFPYITWITDFQI